MLGLKQLKIIILSLLFFFYGCTIEKEKTSIEKEKVSTSTKLPYQNLKHFYPPIEAQADQLKKILEKYLLEIKEDPPDKNPPNIEFITLIIPEITKFQGILRDIYFVENTIKKSSYDISTTKSIEDFIKRKVSGIKIIRDKLIEASKPMQPLLENKDNQEVVDINNKVLLVISDFLVFYEIIETSYD